MSRHTNGISVYLSDEIQFKYQLIRRIVTENLSIVTMQIFNNFLITIVYRSPNSSIIHFNKTLSEHLKELKLELVENHLLIGDFNTDWNNPRNTHSIEQLKSITKSFGLRQLINEPTRITNTSKTIIDLVFVNKFFKELDIEVLDPIITDHAVIEIKTRFDSIKHNKINNTKTIITYNEEQLNDELNNIKFENVNQNPFLIMDNQVHKIINKFEKVINKPNNNNYINNSLKKLQKQKYYTYKLYKYYPTNKHWLKFKKIRNELSNKIKRSKNEYYNKIISNNNNQPKKLWNILKGLYNENKYPTTLSFNNVEITDKNYVVETINKSFVSKINELTKNIKIIIKRTLTPYNNSSFHFKPFELNDLLESINKIKQSKVNNIYKKYSIKFVDKIIISINDIFKYNQFPENLKISEITPIYKKGNTNEISNLRPINNLSFFSKLIENILYKQINNYIIENNLLELNQYAYTKNSSCEVAINNVLYDAHVNKIQSIPTVIIFLDLTNAFDTINRELLLFKLSTFYGFSNNAIDLLKSYFDNRYQFVKLNNTKSKMAPCNTGVVQGTVLGPLLFNLFINDIFKLKLNSKLQLYADDVVLMSSDKDINKLQENINKDLITINEWLENNGLIINTNKSKYLVINKTNITMNITMNNYLIEKVNKIKFLGIILNNELNIDDHMDYLLKDINNKTWLLNRIKSKLNKESKISLIKQLIIIKLNYCSTYLYQINKTQIKKLTTTINRAFKTVLGEDRLIPTKELLRKYNVLSAKQLIWKNTLIYIHKGNLGLIPENILERQIVPSPPSSYNLRTSNTFIIATSNNYHFNSQWFVNALQIYKNLPMEIISSNLKNFKNYITDRAWELEVK